MVDRLVAVGEDFLLPTQVLDALREEFVSAETLRGYVRASDYGLAADGVSNDAAPLLTAMQQAIALNLPLLLPAFSVIRVGSRIDAPATLVLFANNAEIRGLTATGDFLLRFGSGTTVLGHLKVTPAAGTNVRAVSFHGTNISGVRLDSLTVVAPNPAAGAGDLNDSALLVQSVTDLNIRQLTIENFDFPVKIAGSSGVTIDLLNIETYVRGVYLTDSKDVWINGGVISGASPNAAVNPGHNGVLIDATAHRLTSNLHFSNIAVRDAGEHGWRIGGNFKVNDVWFDKCSAVNVGGCGIKVLGGTIAANNYHENIFIDSPLIEDAGQTPENAAGVMLQFVKNVQVDRPIIRRNLKPYSAGQGIEIQAAEDVQIIDPIIRDTMVDVYKVGYVLGNCTNVKFYRGLLSTSSGNGITINYTGRTFRRVSVEGYPQVEIGGTGFILNIETSTGGAVVGGSWLTWQSVSAAERQVNGNGSGWFCDVFAPFTGAPIFKNGSEWRDNSTGVKRERDAGTWKTPTLT